ncbi:hypothetical protein X768_16605 [Mesorhizobium sp. LSJC265A00]|nr:hypothetical protein X768_16605 [Mesorhizobium sp. LSJC265A00]
MQKLATSALMSSRFQAVMRGPSFTGWGKRPSRTPAHHVERLTGMGPSGAKMLGNRTKPVAPLLIEFSVVIAISFAVAKEAQVTQLYREKENSLGNSLVYAVF